MLDKYHNRSSSPVTYQQSKPTFFLSKKTIVTRKHLYMETKANLHIPIIENVCVVLCVKSERLISLPNLFSVLCTRPQPRWQYESPTKTNKTAVITSRNVAFSHLCFKHKTQTLSDSGLIKHGVSEENEYDYFLFSLVKHTGQLVNTIFIYFFYSFISL